MLRRSSMRHGHGAASRALSASVRYRGATLGPYQASHTDFVNHFFPEVSQFLGFIQSNYKPVARFSELNRYELESMLENFPQAGFAYYMARRLQFELKATPRFPEVLATQYEVQRLGIGNYAPEIASIAKRIDLTQASVADVVAAVNAIADELAQGQPSFAQLFSTERMRAFAQLLASTAVPPEVLAEVACAATPVVQWSPAQARQLSELAGLLDAANVSPNASVAQIADQLAKVAHSTDCQRALQTIHSLVQQGVLHAQSCLSDYAVDPRLAQSLEREIPHLEVVRLELLGGRFRVHTPSEVLAHIHKSFDEWPWCERLHDIQRVHAALERLANTMPGTFTTQLDILVDSHRAGATIHAAKAAPSVDMDAVQAFGESLARPWAAYTADDLAAAANRWDAAPPGFAAQFSSLMTSVGHSPAVVAEIVRAYSSATKRHKHKYSGSLFSEKIKAKPSAPGPAGSPPSRPPNREASTAPEYVQIPDKLFLHEEVAGLQALRHQMAQPFVEATPEQVLSATTRMGEAGTVDLADCNRLYAKLNKLFAINGGNTEVLDAVLSSHSAFEQFEKRLAPAEYTQIPDKMFLHDEIFALQVVHEYLSSAFAEATPQQVLEALAKVGASAEGELDLADANRLYAKLTTLFAINGGNTECLDAVLRSHTVFKEFERKLAQKQPPPASFERPHHRQIESVALNRPLFKTIEAGVPGEAPRHLPPDLQLPEYSTELAHLRSLLGTSFADADATEVLQRLEDEINRGTLAEVFDYIRLQKRLERLFVINGGYTGALDAVANAATAPANASVYTQLADDFSIHQYAPELRKLRETLGAPFAMVPSHTVLAQVEALCAGQLIWNKLYRNLVAMFAANGNDTAVLDAVLVSEAAFDHFEASLHLDRAFAATRDLLNADAPGAAAIVDQYVSENGPATTISRPLFDKFIEAQVAGGSSTAETIQRLTTIVDYYPSFLQQLLEIDHDLPGHKWTAQEVEEIYKAFMCVVEYDLEICSEIDEIYHDSVADRVENHDWRDDYNDSERLVSLLQKQTTPVDFDVLKQELGQEELFIKDAVSIALNNEEPAAAAPYNTANTVFNQGAPKLDKGSLHSYLESAKHKHEIGEGERAREQTAFAWSQVKARHQSHMPVVEWGSSASANHPQPLFPGTQTVDPGLEYQLLTIDGTVVPSNAAAIGEVPHQEIFQVVRTMDPADMKQFMYHVHKHERDGWKVVGSRRLDNHSQVLILARDPTGARKPRGWANGIKNAFAVAGAGFLAMVGLNFALKEEHAAVPPPVAAPVQEVAPEHTVPVEQPAEPQPLSLVSRLLWDHPTK
ncbi:hypothetical protein DICA4_F10770 [Diutina catenulata]